MIEQLRDYRRLSFALYVPLTLIMVYYNSTYTTIGNYIYPFYIILAVVALINFASYLIERGRCIEHPVLSGATFFIYAFHAFLALTIAKAILIRVIPQSETYWLSMLIRYLLTAPMAIAICIGVQHLMKHFCPRILNVLTGSRDK